LPLKELTPDAKNIWLTEGMDNDFDSLLPMGRKSSSDGNSIFIINSNGNDSGRDSWVYNFNKIKLEYNVKMFSDNYNSELDRYLRNGNVTNLDDFLLNDPKKIKWTRNAKRDLKLKRYAIYETQKIRNSAYRPFIKTYLFSGKIYNKEVAQFPKIFPTLSTENENIVICLSGIGNTNPLQCIMTNIIPDLHLTGDSQCFPFYTYKEDGTGRKENISDWALKQYQEHYKDESITKWDIFYYIYGVLHTPAYKEKYSANLRRSLPRIPFYEDFRKYSTAGKKLAELHVNYETQPEYYLQKIEAPGKKLDWKVVKMKLSKDKTTIIYNDFLSMTGIPYEVFEYKLGVRSALEWIIDQYQIKTDKRSGIVNDPNREDEPDYIVRLIGKIVTVSLETVKIVRELGGL
jgi:predicted helicase